MGRAQRPSARSTDSLGRFQCSCVRGNYPKRLSPSLRSQVILRARAPMRGERVETIVRATCPTCGDVELKPADLELRICSTPAFSIYVFSCTTCDTLVAKPAADHRIVTLLSSVGVPMVRWDLPAELEETHEGPPL